MRYHYVWLWWSSGFLLPWLALYVTNPQFRPVMWRVSLVTAAFGLTEPIFVPEYWNPPSLFELAQRTGFDIESLIFSFAIGGIGAVLYNALTKRPFGPVSAAERSRRFIGSIPCPCGSRTSCSCRCISCLGTRSILQCFACPSGAWSPPSVARI